MGVQEVYGKETKEEQTFVNCKQKEMNQSHSDRGQQQKGLKGVMCMMGICLVCYVVGPPLYWHLSDILFAALRSSSSSLYCPPCFCDCSSQPLLSIPDECMKHDPNMSEEMEKSFTDLLSEEVRLRETEALKEQRRVDVALLEAKKVASQYQKEADKCNAGMETCEGARESAEAALEAQRKLGAMWEHRGLQRGWKDDARRSHALL